LAIIHINQIGKRIKELFSNYVPVDDLKTHDPERDLKILSRCLAAYAVYIAFDCSVEEAASSVVDGSNDNGIDALHYSSNQKKFVIVQSKWSKDGTGSPDSASVLKFCAGIRDLLDSNLERFNERVNAKKEIIHSALNDYGNTFELIFIDTKTKEMEELVKRNIDDLVNENNNNGDVNADELFHFTHYNQGRVYSSLAGNGGNDPINVDVALNEWGKINDPYASYYGNISGSEIADWWSVYGTKLFEKNIRQTLGKTDINSEIERTIREFPEKFWYFNNGITVIADKVEKTAMGGSSREIGAFKLSNIAVVNGAQTVSTIGRFKKSNPETSMDSIKVPLRVIQLAEAPVNFGTEVTRANNRQNKIENRDFVSQDPEQIRIQSELRMEGIDYSIMRSETFSASDTTFDVDEALVSLACASGNCSIVTQVKGGVGKIYENLEGGYYKTLFNPNVTGVYVNCVVKLNRKIEKIRNAETSKLGSYSGKDYGTLVHGNRMIALLVMSGLKAKDVFAKGETFSFPDEEVEKVFSQSLLRLKETLAENYSDNTLGSLFKNSTKCNAVYNKIMATV
jgi:hypothetical protein